MGRRGRKRKKRRKAAHRAGRPGRAATPQAPPAEEAPATGPGGLRIRRRLTWQVAVRPLPELETGSIEEGRAYETPMMPWGAICVSSGSGFLGARITDPERPAPGPDDVAALLEDLAAGEEAWPGTIEVEDSALAEALADRFGESGIAISLREQLRHIDRYLEREAERKGQVMLEPSLATARGVTDDLLRGFHAAWAALAERPLGSLLEDTDLLHVEAPELPGGAAPAWCIVGGRQGPLVDRLQFAERAEDACRRGAIGNPRPGGPETTWFVDLSPVTHLTPADYAAFRRLGLGTIGPGRWVPRAWCLVRRRFRAPDGPLLAWFEAVLRGLAATRREHLEEGRWEVKVETSAGSVTCRFSCHAVSGELSRIAELELSADLDPRQTARALAMTGRVLPAPQRWARARKALEIDPGCPEALFLLALAEEDRERRVEALRHVLAVAKERREEWLAEYGGKDAGRGGEKVRRFPLVPPVERELDPEDAGHVSILVQAAFALAREFEMAGRFAEAADALLEVTWFPEEHGVHRHLLDYAFRAGRADLVDDVIEAFGVPGEEGPRGVLWAWAEALYRFMVGERALAEAWLRGGMERAPGVAGGILRDPVEAGDDEGRYAAALLWEPWRAVPGALDWLFRRDQGIRRHEEEPIG